MKLGPKLINRIDQARYYIDACFYQLSLPEVIGAKERDLSIRFSTQNENTNEYQVTQHLGISNKFWNVWDVWSLGCLKGVGPLGGKHILSPKPPDGRLEIVEFPRRKLATKGS